MFRQSLAAIAALLLLAGCGTSETFHKVTTEERNPDWQAVGINRIMVVAVTEDRGERLGSETVFVDRFKQLGIDAEASYNVFPDLNSIDTSDEAAMAMAGHDIDAVLTIGVAKPAAGYDRGAYWEARGWAYLLGSDNSRAWGNLADINNYWSQGEHSVDIGLWDAKAMQPIWHAQTDSNEWDESSAGVQRLAEAIAGMLSERGLIGNR